eukprot:scaffold229963_cov36-Prasinocladus_malaysianus.AAC.1
MGENFEIEPNAPPSDEPLESSADDVPRESVTSRFSRQIHSDASVSLRIRYSYRLLYTVRQGLLALLGFASQEQNQRRQICSAVVPSLAIGFIRAAVSATSFRTVVTGNTKNRRYEYA